MKCETFTEMMPGMLADSLSATELADCKQHVAGCADCADALRGTEALTMLAHREAGPAPAGLLGRIAVDLESGAGKQAARGFWLGTGFGGAVAAAIFGLALALGWIGPPVGETTPGQAIAAPEFVVGLGEARNMDLAIETEAPLAGATISVVLSGAVALDGYGNTRELTWTADLAAGINRLSLPVRALDPAGGRMVVRLSHPDSEQVFVVRLRTQA